jgi:homeobox protein cut-like
MDSFAFTEGIVPDTNDQDREAEKDTSGKLPEGANKFQRAIAAWRGTFIEIACCDVPGR